MGARTFKDKVKADASNENITLDVGGAMLTVKPEQIDAAEIDAHAPYWNYFKRGTTSATCEKLDKYLWDRTYRWAKRKYTRSRGGHGQAARQVKMQAARKKVKRGRRILEEIRAKEAMYFGAASYAQ